MAVDLLRMFRLLPVQKSFGFSCRCNRVAANQFILESFDDHLQHVVIKLFRFQCCQPVLVRCSLTIDQCWLRVDDQSQNIWRLGEQASGLFAYLVMRRERHHR